LRCISDFSDGITWRLALAAVEDVFELKTAVAPDARPVALIVTSVDQEATSTTQREDMLRLIANTFDLAEQITGDELSDHFRLSVGFRSNLEPTSLIFGTLRQSTKRKRFVGTTVDPSCNPSSTLIEDASRTIDVSSLTSQAMRSSERDWLALTIGPWAVLDAGFRDMAFVDHATF
jgi:hypothetical protein